MASLTERQRAHPELAAALKTRERTLSLRRARALAKVGDFKAAAAAFEAPVAAAPADAALQREYAQVLIRAGRGREAVEVARAHVRRQAASGASVELLVAVRQWLGQETARRAT